MASESLPAVEGGGRYCHFIFITQELPDERISTNEIAAQGEVDTATGKKCVQKVMMKEETRYEEVMTCNHSYDERCHTSYVTSFQPHQEEDCEEKFRKVTE